MTPEEYQQIAEHNRGIIQACEDVINDARALAEGYVPNPKDLRPAVAKDIKEGAIIYYDNSGEGWFWCVVESPLHYGDDWKAYMADDGCRYGLRDAWVRKEAGK